MNKSAPECHLITVNNFCFSKMTPEDNWKGVCGRYQCALVLQFDCLSQPPGGPVKTQIAGSHPGVSGLKGVGRGPGI